MSAWWLLLVWLFPLLLIPLSLTRAAGWIPVAAISPALAGALLLPVGSQLEIPWLLLGLTLGLDGLGRAFLVFSALIWLAAALAGRDWLRDDPDGGRFRVFFLFAMAGNLLLILAQDAVGFFLGFALMGLAGYGIVVRGSDPQALRAGRLYIAWTMLGEILLFSGIILTVAGAGSTAFDRLAEFPPGGAGLTLLLLGFGIKLALPGLHLWLPITYGAAHPVGIIVLSGAMMKAGLLGLLRFLPLGETSAPLAGGVLITAGTATAFAAVLIGLVQRSPRVLLGYSSMSQMGMLAAALGVVLTAPDAAPVLLPAVVLYAAHHALAKSGLFLGLGLLEERGRRPWIWAGMLLLALALAGAPLTSGGTAKVALKEAVPESWAWLTHLQSLGTVATTVLMARLLVLIGRPAARTGAGGVLPVIAWSIPLTAALILPVLHAGPSAAWSVTLALGLGIVLALIVWSRTPTGLSRWIGRIPPGDLQVLAGPLGARFFERIRSAEAGRQRLVLRPLLRAAALRADEIETSMRAWPAAGLAWLLVAGLLTVALLLGR